MAARRYALAAGFAALALVGCSSPDLSGVATYEPVGMGATERCSRAGSS
ncbi:hypothetical protein [Nocardioides sp. SR21]|nr:hypothetical protein [Nocardioides sp. SR21]